MTEAGLRRKELERIWERVVRGECEPSDPAVAGMLRADIIDSWSLLHGRIDPSSECAPVREDLDIWSRWRESRLRQPVTELADELQRIADDAGYVAAVTDEGGTILWTSGCRLMRRRAERVNFVPGGCFSEEAAGTNALGLALRTDRPSTVYSAEHVVERLHDFVCYSAPIHDPCGRQLGVIDLSSVWDRANALGLTTVRMLASVIETRLRDTWDERADESGARVELQCLGGSKLLIDGRPVRATLRQLEILALLALRPAGFSPGELAAEIYGDRWVAATTLKSEVCHVRRLLGGALAARTYALLAPVKCDAVEVLEALSRGDVTAAVQRYAGPLLPQSEAPGIIAWRDQLEVAIRDAVLASDSPEPALALGEVNPYDSELHEHALRRLAPTDRRRHLALGRLHTAEVT
ncbi:MAG: transcriptional regulator [Mycobacterium sp.]|uniref:helix-turn-helix domain-containing protein n=1 Tax=Mycobacterium sp. TaxID=1785 RepID=UPI0026298450|nr:helix-turn-helix domain-containing protein [Mycobacterium sp.]MDI3313151.1 transcriptional regulator [Mycobacterium sp.]